MPFVVPAKAGTSPRRWSPAVHCSGAAAMHYTREQGTLHTWMRGSRLRARERRSPYAECLRSREGVLNLVALQIPSSPLRGTSPSGNGGLHTWMRASRLRRRAHPLPLLHYTREQGTLHTWMRGSRLRGNDGAHTPLLRYTREQGPPHMDARFPPTRERRSPSTPPVSPLPLTVGGWADRKAEGLRPWVRANLP